MASSELAKAGLFDITPYDGASNLEQFDNHAILYTAFAKLAIHGEVVEGINDESVKSILTQDEVLTRENANIIKAIGWYLCELDENGYAPGITSDQGIPAKELSVIHDKPEEYILTSGKFVDTPFMKGAGMGLPVNFIYGQDLIAVDNEGRNGSLPKSYVINAYDLADAIKNKDSYLEVGDVRRPPA